MAEGCSEPAKGAEDEDESGAFVDGEMDESCSESTDLAQAYLDEDPSGLSDEELREIAVSFGIPLEQTKAISEGMATTRAEFAVQEGFERCPDCNRWYRAELGECSCQGGPVGG